MSSSLVQKTSSVQCISSGRQSACHVARLQNCQEETLTDVTLTVKKGCWQMYFGNGSCLHLSAMITDMPPPFPGPGKPHGSILWPPPESYKTTIKALWEMATFLLNRLSLWKCRISSSGKRRTSPRSWNVIIFATKKQCCCPSRHYPVNCTFCRFPFIVKLLHYVSSSYLDPNCMLYCYGKFVSTNSAPVCPMESP